MGCLRAMAYPRSELDGLSVEESLRSIGRSVAPATDAAYIARYVRSLFEAKHKFVSEPGATYFFRDWR